MDALTGEAPVEAPSGGPGETPVPVIDEEAIPKRLRRPLDLARLVAAVALAAALFVFAYFATGTTAGLEEDLTEASRQLPPLVILVLNVIGGIGLLTLPVAVAVDLLVRGRGRQLLDALIALFVATTVLTVAAIIIDQFATDRVRVSLAGSLSEQDESLLPLYGGLVAFITVAGVMSRHRWNAIATVVVASLFIVTVLSGGINLAGVGLSVLLGWAIGLAARYTLGTPTTRPSGHVVAGTLLAAGFPLAELRATGGTDVGRHYRAKLRDERQLNVVVLDRDLEGAGLAQSVWRGLRLRDAPGRGAFNMRQALEQRALMSHACQTFQVPIPKLLLASEIGPDAAILAYEYLDGTRLEDLPPDALTDQDLEAAFQALRGLQDNHIAHRSLSPKTLLRQGPGEVALTSVGGGLLAPGDVTARIDVADMLCSLAAAVGPDRAVTVGRRVLGDEGLSRALPVLQPVALGHDVRPLVKDNKDLLPQLRDALVTLRPDGAIEQIQIERIKPRTLLTIVLGSVAGYLLLSQLAEVDVVGLFRDASWGWLAVAFAFSLATYPGSAWAVRGFVPERVPMGPTVAAQVAADFATLVTPPTLGTVAINLRFLQKHGIHPALATASLGVSQVAAFIVHITFMLGFGVAAGTQADFTFQPPRAVVLAGVAILVIVVGLVSLPPIRNRLWNRVAPLLRQVGPRMITVTQQPRKLLEGVGGIALVNAGYIGTLTACVYALGGDANIAAIAMVYLTGTVIGQAAPTPGGLGAVEAAMAAGLTAVGLASGLAVSAVLMYRVITFWLPTIPGWFALNYLTRKEML